MAKNRLFYLLALFAALLFHVFYTGWFSWYLLIFALALPLFVLLVSLPAMRACHLESQLPSVCGQGDECSYCIELKDGPVLPAPVGRVRIVFEDDAEGTQNVQILTMSDTHAFRCRILTEHVGSFCFHPTHARVFDYLGLFSLPVCLPQERRIDVLPSPEEPAEHPNLGRFCFQSFRPKSGGGFSETHETREYRPGDSLRDIHWKLSAKTDSMIVREAMEPNCGQIVLTLDLCGTRDQLDSVLGQLVWLSRWLLDHQTRHEVNWLDPESFALRSAEIDSEQALLDLVTSLVRTGRSEQMPSMESRIYPHADWRYHIRPRAGEVET